MSFSERNPRPAGESPRSANSASPESGAAVRGSPGLSARERSRMRKAFYLLAIIGLIVLLFVLSHPSSPDVKGHPGGVLAHLRDQYGLTQTELGAIDPTSQAVYLASMGMRGVGICVLWSNANQYQMKKDWTQLRASLDQISKFQPHSINVWRHQAWNLSYNVSVAFDDYHDKFYWVIEGLNYMLEGVRLNEKESRLYWDTAWFISNKIGRADEAKYYRRLFTGKKDVSERQFRDEVPNDDSGGDFAPDYVKDFRERDTPPTGFPHGCDVRDNWHVGKAWFLAAESRIDPPKYPVRGMADVIFYSDATTAQFYYADNIEKDGCFDKKAVNAWKVAADEWHEFGEKPIWNVTLGEKLQMNRKEEYDAIVAKDVAELDRLAPGQRNALYKEKLARLTPEEREAWTTADDKRTSAQNTLAFGAKDRMEVKNEEVAHRVHGTKSAEAEKLAKEIAKYANLAMWISRERSKVNFDFWRTRADAEQTPECIAARKAIHDGDDYFAKGDQVSARKFYRQGIKRWRKVLDNFPSLIDDVNLGSDLADTVKRYQKCLDQDDVDLIDDKEVSPNKQFILEDIMKRWGNRN